jgi:hypothetical protein
MDSARKAQAQAVAQHLSRKVERVFSRLPDFPFFSDQDRQEFTYYRRYFHHSIDRIGSRLQSGELTPLDLTDFPRVVRMQGYRIQAALFIGSFDPFQMTHLATALRYLSHPKARGNVVFVVPEGGVSASKPNRSEYRYRFEILSHQLKGIFDPLIVPLDIGEGADTIEIVRRFMALFAGGTVDLTHILGSDVFPYAVRLYPEDLAAWKKAALELNVDFSYRCFVSRRPGAGPAQPHAKKARALGVPVDIDARIVDAPSSTDFRERRAFTIAFPTDAMLKHMEILFRYNLNRSWISKD